MFILVAIKVYRYFWWLVVWWTWKSESAWNLTVDV